METEMVERCLHERTSLAFSAARDAGLPGTFRTFQSSGLLATLASGPGLELFNWVSGVTAATVEGLAQILETWEESKAPPPSLTTRNCDAAVDAQLRDLGFVPAGRRPVAVLDLCDVPNAGRGRINADVEVCEALGADERRTFLEVLVAGYESPTPLRNFMSAEHSADQVRRFVGCRSGRPVAAGAISAHHNVMVLGGAAVLRSARGCGGQAALLQHRVRAAAAAGCEAAIATAAVDSPSVRNLDDAGFDIRFRPAWRWSPRLTS